MVDLSDSAMAVDGDGPAAASTSPPSFRIFTKASSTIVRPFRWIQAMVGVSYEVDIASSEFLFSLIACVLLMAVLVWWSRRQRRAAYLSAHTVGSPGFARLVARHEAIIQSRKEQGNRAYIDRDYERAAAHFEAARDEAVHLIKLHHPSIQVVPLTLPEVRDGSVDSSIDEPTGARTTMPPPGQFRTKPNPALEHIPTNMLNNLAVYASNRSACLLALNRYDDALIEAELARHLQPLWSKGFLRAGQAYEGLGLFARAKAMYTTGARADPSDENVAKCLRNLRLLEAEVEETRRDVIRDREKYATAATGTSDAKQGGGAQVDQTDRFDTLISWLTSRGAQFPYLYMKQYEPDHRGVHTLCRLPANKIVLSVPYDCIMTSDLARAFPIGQLLTNVDLSSNHSYLASFLLEERRKGPASDWSAYINVLPREYSNMPIFFRPDDKAWLRGSFTLDKIDERRRELKQEYENICKGLEGIDLDDIDEEAETDGGAQTSGLTRRPLAGKKSASPRTHSPKSIRPIRSSASRPSTFADRHTLNDFIWARTVVITRVFGFSMNVPSTTTRSGFMPYKTDGLVPMADMLNHKRPRESTWMYDDSRGAFIITSLIALSPRQEVCDSYGRKCNSRFFVNYGFCLEENSDDNQAVVWVGIDTDEEDTQLTQQKQKLLGINDNNQSTQTLAQSASSLSSSGYILSRTPVSSSASLSDDPAPVVSYPPPRTLRFQIPTTYSDKVTQEIFSLLRVMRTDSTEFDRMRRGLASTSIDVAVRNVGPISLANELRVLATLRQAAIEALAQFENTREEDEIMLQKDAAARQLEESGAEFNPNDRLTSNQRNCVLMRRGEKEVHLFYIALHEEVQTILVAYQSQVVSPPPSASSSSSSSSLGPTSPALPFTQWDAFVRVYIEPRYASGEGVYDFYVSSVIVPLLQSENDRRLRAL